MTTTRVAVNGYGVIGKRVADAVRAMPDMELVGVADVATDWHIRTAIGHDIPVLAATEEAEAAMRAAYVPVAERLEGLVGALHSAGRAAPRIAFIRMADGLVALNTTVELMRDLGRPRSDIWEVALWEDVLTVEGDEAYLTYQVYNAMTDAALGMRQEFLPAPTAVRGHEAVKGSRT